MTYQADYHPTLDAAPPVNPAESASDGAQRGGSGARLRAWWVRLSERLQFQYRLFQAAALVISPAPRWLAQPLTIGGATLVWALARGKRRHVEANLRHIPTVANEPRRLLWAGRSVFIHSALNYLDFFQGRRFTDAYLLTRWPSGSIEGYEHVAEALAKGRGLIVFAAHFGDFEAAISRLGVDGHRLLVPAEHLTPEALFQLACRMREHHNARLLAADSRETLREMIGALKRNEIILIAFDRYIHGESTLLPFFGAPTRLPTASVAFALRREAPVMFMNSWRVSGAESHAVCIPLDLSGAVPGESAAASDGAVFRSQSTNDTTYPDGGRTQNKVDLPATTSNPRPSSGAKIATSAATSLPTQHDQRVDSRQTHAMRIILGALERNIADHPEQWVSALAHIWDDSPPQAHS